MVTGSAAEATTRVCVFKACFFCYRKPDSANNLLIDDDTPIAVYIGTLFITVIVVSGGGSSRGELCQTDRMSTIVVVLSI